MPVSSIGSQQATLAALEGFDVGCLILCSAPCHLSRLHVLYVELARLLRVQPQLRSTTETVELLDTHSFTESPGVCLREPTDNAPYCT